MKIFFLKLRFLLFIPLLILTIYAKVPAQSNGDRYTSTKFESLSEDVLPEPFVFIDKYEESYIFLVEKRNQKLSILKNNNGVLSVETNYLCSTGKVWGDKEFSGDLKTPEGIYFFRSRKDSSDLPPLYGAGAFVLDYPNRYDNLKGKNGHGIWLHGTNEPERIKNSNDTRGCVVLENDDFLDAAEYIEINQTPIIIVNELQYRKKDYVLKDREDIIGLIESWKNSWMDKDIDKYMSFYSKRFRFKTMNVKRFKAYKRSLFNRYKNETLNVDISHVQILRADDNILVSFVQDFSTNSYADYGTKQIYLIREENDYKIVGENWKEKKRSFVKN